MEKLLKAFNKSKIYKFQISFNEYYIKYELNIYINIFLSI